MTATEAEALPHDPAFRCAPWTQAQGVDPVGSTVQLDHLLLVEWPLPWPADVGDIPELAEAATADKRTRVMCVVPRLDDGDDGRFRVVHHRRVGPHELRGVDHRVPLAEIPALLRSIQADPAADSSGWPTAVGPSPPEVLVCGHGKRDACCGRWGTLLHVELMARSTDVRVWRCSHTGGHRFAPTAITLPDGRGWAYADADLLEAVVRRRGDLALISPHDRGTSALSPWAQVVERAVLRERGWSWLDEPRLHAEVTVREDGEAADVILEWDGGRATAVVVIERTIPVLVCGYPPEAAQKSSAEYGIRDLRIT